MRNATSVLWVFVAAIVLSCAGAPDDHRAPPAAVASASSASDQAAECTVDDECGMMADYCHGRCDCVPVPPRTSFALDCPEPVQCFVDPCLFAQPVCDQGICTVSSGGSTR